MSSIPTPTKATRMLQQPFLHKTSPPPIMLTNLNQAYIWYWVAPIIASVVIFVIVVIWSFIKTRPNAEPKIPENERRFSFLGPVAPAKPKPSTFGLCTKKHCKSQTSPHKSSRCKHDTKDDFIFLQVKSGENFVKLKESLKRMNMQLDVSEDQFASYVITEVKGKGKMSDKKGHKLPQTDLKDPLTEKTPSINGSYINLNMDDLSSLNGRETNSPTILHLTPMFVIEQTLVNKEVPSGSSE